MDPIKELREISTPLPFEEQHMMQLIGSFNSEDTLTITRLPTVTIPRHPISTNQEITRHTLRALVLRHLTVTTHHTLPSDLRMDLKPLDRHA